MEWIEIGITAQKKERSVKFHMDGLHSKSGSDSTDYFTKDVTYVFLCYFLLSRKLALKHSVVKYSAGP